MAILPEQMPKCLGKVVNVTNTELSYSNETGVHEVSPSLICLLDCYISMTTTDQREWRMGGKHGGREGKNDGLVIKRGGWGNLFNYR